MAEPASYLAAFSALCSAIAAGLICRIHYLNARHAIRPEIAISESTFKETEHVGEIWIHKIRNIGNGPALNIRFELKVPGYTGQEPAAWIESRPLLLLPHGESERIELHGAFFWKHGPKLWPQAPPFIPLRLSVRYHDARENRYETLYELTAYGADPRKQQFGNLIGGTDVLTPGVSLMTRVTRLTHSAFRITVISRTQTLAKKLKSLADDPRSYPPD